MKRQVRTTHPSADICIKRNKLKKYHGNNTIYMNDGNEFEIFLDNTTDKIWGVRIKLNGEYIDDTLILRPGERTFLECDPSTNKKFKFDTYSVPENRKHLISKNGLVTIEFCREYKPLEFFKINFDDYFDKKYPPYDKYTNPWIWDSGTITPYYGSTSGQAEIKSSGNLSTSGAKPLNVNFLSNESSNEIETGRVNEGSVSNQKFGYASEQIENFPSHVVEYRIFPVSRKKTEIQDIRQYCGNCGRKKRKNDNFCPNCGKKL